MSRYRIPKIILSSALIALELASVGCARRTLTRVFLHGETVGDTMQPVPHVVVRLRGRETVSDENGHYRFLYLANCLKLATGKYSTVDDEIRAYAEGFAPYRMDFGVPAKELLSSSNCPKETDKYLRLELTRSEPPQYEHGNKNRDGGDRNE